MQVNLFFPFPSPMSFPVLAKQASHGLALCLRGRPVAASCCAHEASCALNPGLSSSAVPSTPADLMGSPVARPTDIETSVLGAAYAAGLAIGVWTEEWIYTCLWISRKTYNISSQLFEEVRKRRTESWHKAMSRTFDLADL